MTSRRKQLEKTLAETKDNVVRMQLTKMLNEELERQNGIIKKVADAIDSLLREMIGLIGKRSPRKKSRDRTKIGRTIEKQLTQKSAKKQLAPKSGKKELAPKPAKKQLAQKLRQKEQDTVQNQPDDLAEIIALWPRLPEHVKAAISDIVRIS